MCLILFSYQPESPSNTFILAANRDEFFSRETQPADYWDDAPQVLAGRDLVGLGTWLGITKTGRFAAVTNVREPNVVVVNPRSRGELTRDFLVGHDSPLDYLEAIKSRADRYAGFNLLVGEFTSQKSSLLYFSNRQDEIQTLSAGVYGLSNYLLNSAWPKVEDGKTTLSNLLNAGVSNDHQALRSILENPLVAEDERLPSTGVSYEREKALSASFITLGDYGTRATTVLTLSQTGIEFSEQNYSPSHNNLPNALNDLRTFSIDF